MADDKETPKEPIRPTDGAESTRGAEGTNNREAISNATIRPSFGIKVTAGREKDKEEGS